MKASARSALAWLALLAGPACLDSPYANLGEILDATVSIAGTTWIASVDTASGPEVRLLVVAGPDSPSGRTFIHTSMIGIAPVRKLVGTWSTDGAGTVTFAATTEYVLADEASKPVASRAGSRRLTVDVRQTVSARLEGGSLVLSGGDGSLDGSYHRLDRALSRLGTAGATAAACFFQAFNVTVVSSQVRILGFNSAAIAQYTSPATFAGEASGNLVISLTNLLSPLTDITYGSFSDFPEMVVDGTQMTKVNLSGNGFMYGTLDFTFLPVDADGKPLSPVHGSVSYGTPDGGGNSIRLTNGNVTGGSYTVSGADGLLGMVEGSSPPSPSIAACLGL